MILYNMQRRWRDILFFILISLFIIPNLHSEIVQHEPFIIHAIPKCGNHFLGRIIMLLTGKDNAHSPITNENLEKFEKNQKILRFSGVYDKNLKQLLVRKKYKLIAIHRDSRDAITSLLFYMREYKGKGIWRDFFKVSSNFDNLSFEQQLTALITGTSDMQSYLDFYTSRMGWSLDPQFLGVKFEDLIGPQGGGNDEEQRNTVLKIANYLGIKLSTQKLQWILDNMYDKTSHSENSTFVRSSIGNWKKFFNPQQIQLYKKSNDGTFYLIKLGYEKKWNW